MEEIKFAREQQKNEIEILKSKTEALEILKGQIEFKENQYSRNLVKYNQDREFTDKKIKELQDRENTVKIEEERLRIDLEELRNKQDEYVYNSSAFMENKVKFEDILVNLNKDIDKRRNEVIKDKTENEQIYRGIVEFREQVTRERQTLEKRSVDFKIRKQEVDDKLEAIRSLEKK